MNSLKSDLLSFLKRNSVFYGDFTLSSGAKSRYYIDCRLTTLHAQGAWLVGQVLHQLIRQTEAQRGVCVRGVGGLTMGADPISMAIAMVSAWANDPDPLQPFVVRKAPKGHGQTKLIEGSFKSGDSVVVVDDVITRGDSTLTAIQAITREGGKVAFVAVLVDREEGGRQKIEQAGHPVVAVFQRGDLISELPPQ